MKYQYKCCGMEELDFPIGKAVAPKCKCGKIMERFITTAVVHFNGSGFSSHKMR